MPAFPFYSSFAFASDVPLEGSPETTKRDINNSRSGDIYGDLFSGNAKFSIPIEAAPGRNGPFSQFSINYQSDSGPSWVGYGWELDFGKIRRTGLGGKTPTYTTEDEFFLSGAGTSSKLISAGIGDPNAFKTQYESFLKITRDIATDQWIIKSPEGFTFEFGVTADSKIEAVLFDQNTNNFFTGSGFDQTREWLLDKITDANGNYVQFWYSEDTLNGDVYPSQIVYSKNDNGDNSIYQMVRFILEARPDVVTSFATGSKVTEDYRLSKIRAWSNQARNANLNLVREYRFNYSPSDSTDRDVQVVNWISPYSKLVNVQEFGRDAVSNLSAVGLPAYRFEYYPQQTGWGTDLPQYNIPVPLKNTGMWEYGTRFVDANFDGIADITHGYHNDYSTPPDQNEVYLGNGAGTWTLQSYQTPLFIQNNNFYKGAEPFDINGDFLPDFIQYMKDVNGGVLLRGVYLKQNSYSGWLANNSTWANNLPYPILYGGPNGGGTSYYDYGTRFVDFDRDGITDIIHAVRTTNASHTERKLKFSNGNGTWRDSGWTIPTDMSFSEFLDKSLDLLTGCYGAPGGTAIFDVNNDGLPDILRAINTECAETTPRPIRKTWINTGRGFYEDNSYQIPGDFTDFVPIPNPPPGYSPFWDSGSRPQDFNRDGLMDFCQLRRIWINRGDGIWVDSGVDAPQKTIEIGGSHDGAYFLDINADGLVDQGQSQVNFGTQIRHSYLANGSYPNILKKVTLPSGSTIDYAYTPSSRFDNTGDDAINDLPMVRQVLTSLTVDDKLGTANSIKITNYTYAGGSYDVASNEFRGFQYVKMTDPDNYDHETWFYQSNELRGSVQKEVLSYQGQAINKTKYFYDLVEVPLQVFSTLPVDNSTNVSINNYPNVTFNEAMTDASINASTVKLIRKSDGVVIAQAAGYPQLDITKKIATIKPASSLAYSTWYKIQVIGGAGGVQSPSEQNLTTDYLQPNGFQTQSSGGCTVNCGGCTSNCGGSRDPRPHQKLSGGFF